MMQNRNAAAVWPDGKLNLSGGSTNVLVSLKFSKGLSLQTVFLIIKYKGIRMKNAIRRLINNGIPMAGLYTKKKRGTK